MKDNHSAIVIPTFPKKSRSDTAQNQQKEVLSEIDMCFLRSALKLMETEKNLSLDSGQLFRYVFNFITEEIN